VSLAGVSDGTARLRHIPAEGIRASVAARRETSAGAHIPVMRFEVGLA
jgi:hypothetical protein